MNEDGQIEGKATTLHDSSELQHAFHALQQ